MVYSSWEMNPVTKHNGNGEGRQVSNQPGKIAPVETAASPSGLPESLVTFQTAEGLELQGVPARVTRHLVVFELYNEPHVPAHRIIPLTGIEQSHLSASSQQTAQKSD